MLTRVDLRGFTGEIASMLPRAAVDLDAARDSVRAVVRDVRARGDAAVREASERFGGSPREPRRVAPAEIRDAVGACSPSLTAALKAAADRIRAHHERQAAEERASWWRAGEEGARTGEETRPLRRVGCYVPGGRAAYPSTVLMTTIPARQAGVAEIVVCVPPADRDGAVHSATLAACAIAGIEEVYAAGGAQAIAAMAYGTETVARVDKVVGPGSIWVTLAKHEVAFDVGVDGYAGPTEVAIVADDTAPPRFLAADLVAQAEHDPLATAILVTPSEALADAVDAALEEEVERASRRADVEKALRGQGRVALVEDVERAVAVADAFAPEHLELVVADAQEWLARVRNAGAIFVGAYSPVALGDYVAGTNHVLPTAGTARFASPLRVADFIKSTAVIEFAREGAERVGPWLVEIAEAEGLDAHARALRVRLEEGR